MLTPACTYVALLIVQSAHLLHHRLAKRHISFVEVVSAAVLTSIARLEMMRLAAC